MNGNSATHENNISETDLEPNALVCYSCQSTNAPIWRRDPGDQPLCNTCDLRYVSFPMSKSFVGENHGSEDTTTQHPAGGGPEEENLSAGGVGDKV